MNPLSILFARLREPSTHAALAVLVAVMGATLGVPDAIVQWIASGFAAFAALLPEGPASAP